MIRALSFLFIASFASASPAFFKRQDVTANEYIDIPSQSYGGALIASFNFKNSAAECDDDCNRMPRCHIIEHVRGHCRLLEYSNGAIFSSNAESNIRIKKNPAREYVNLGRVDAVGGQVLEQLNVNQNVCEFLCNNRAECEMISYNLDDERRTCWLMKRADAFVHNEIRNFKVLKQNDPSPTPKMYLKYSNFAADDATAFLGALTFDAGLTWPDTFDMNNETEVSKHCGRHCSVLRDCAAFYHERGSKTCRFFGNGFSSKGAPSEHQRDLYIHQKQPGITYFPVSSIDFTAEGSTIGSIEVTETDCGTYCDNMPGCKGFAYQTATKQCTLKNKLERPSKADGTTFHMGLGQ